MSIKYYPNRSGHLVFRDFAETTITADVSNVSTEIPVAEDVFPHVVDIVANKFFYVVLENNGTADKIICAIDGFIASDPKRLKIAAFNVIGEEINPNTDVTIANGSKIRIAPISLTAKATVFNAPIEYTTGATDDGSAMRTGFLSMDVSMWRPKGFELDTFPKVYNDPVAYNTNGISMIKGDFCTSMGLSNYVKFGANYSLLYGNNLYIKGTPDKNVLVGNNIDIASTSPYEDKNIYVGNNITFSARGNTIIGNDITDDDTISGRPSGVSGIGNNVTFKNLVTNSTFFGDDITFQPDISQIHKGYPHCADLLGEQEVTSAINSIEQTGSKLVKTSSAIDLKSSTYVSEFNFKKNHRLLLEKVGFIIDRSNWNLPTGVNSSAIITFQKAEDVSNPVWVDVHTLSLTGLSGDSGSNDEVAVEDVSTTNVKKFIQYTTDWKLRVNVTTTETDTSGGVVGGFPFIEGVLFSRSTANDPMFYDDPNNYDLGYTDGYNAGLNGGANDPTSGANYIAGSTYYTDGYSVGYENGGAAGGGGGNS